jgi:uncharacterized protein involved in exopolysaccharide biosynthesis
MEDQMNLTNGADPTQNGNVSLIEIGTAILRNWRMVVVLPLIMMLIVGLFSLTRDRQYAASASFVSQRGDARGVSGAAALAQQFGVSLGGDGGAQSPQFYVDVLRSYAILRAAVEQEYEVRRGDALVRGTLIEFLEAEPSRGLPVWRIAAEELRKKMSVSFDWETNVVRMTVPAPNAELAEQVAARMLELVDEFNTEARQRRAQEESRFIAARVADSQAETVAAEEELQAFLRHNRGFANSPELQFEHDRLQRQVMMRQEVYTSLLRSREQTRIDALRDTPILTVIDHPAGSGEPLGRGTVMRVIIAFMVGFILAVFLAFIREFTRRRREVGDPDYREFEGLAQQTWEDVRSPRRWLARRAGRVAAGDV